MTALFHTEAAVQKKTQMENGLLDLMAQRPYQDITVTDICREANIPRRTFYHYFGSKEDVLDSMIETLMQQCLLETMFDMHIREAHMEKRFTRIFQFWEGENRKKLDVLVQNRLESRMIAWVSQWIRREQIGSLQNSDLDPKLKEIGQMAGTTIYFTLLFYWCRGGYQETPGQMAKYAMWVWPNAFHNL